MLFSTVLRNVPTVIARNIPRFRFEIRVIARKINCGIFHSMEHVYNVHEILLLDLRFPVIFATVQYALCAMHPVVKTELLTTGNTFKNSCLHTIGKRK